MPSPSLSSSTTTTTENAVHMNLKGVYRLSSGRYAEAISEFSSSLTTVKSVLATKEANGELNESMSCFSKVQRLAFQFYDASEDGDEEEDEDVCMFDLSKRSRTMDMDTQPFIFSSPIIVSYNTNSSYDDEEENIDSEDFYLLVKFSAAILFNLALSYHLAAMDDNDKIKQKKKLTKALTFYKLSYTMMQDSQNDGVMETMAIANNLGHVHITNSDLVKAKQCYEHLLSTIMFVADHGDRNSIRHFDSFFQSVQTMILPSQSTAQAA